MTSERLRERRKLLVYKSSFERSKTMKQTLVDSSIEDNTMSIGHLLKMVVQHRQHIVEGWLHTRCTKYSHHRKI